MSSRFRAVPFATFALALALACSNQTTAPHNTTPVVHSSLAIAAGVAGAGGALSGTIIGHPATGDSVQVSGATIIVYSLKTVPGSQTDTLPNQTPDSVGAITSASDGTFSVTSIPSGLYELAVVPPSSSGFARRSAPWQFVSDGQSVQVGFVDVYP
jgi:hypothetical protein